jgi:hypothetical protein
MRLEITALTAQPPDDDTAIRGAGVLGRAGYQTQPVDARPAT